MTTRVTLVLWLSDPDVPVTVIVLLPVGVPGLEGPLPPPLPPPPLPQDESVPTNKASTPIVSQRVYRLRLSSRRGARPAPRNV